MRYCEPLVADYIPNCGAAINRRTTISLALIKPQLPDSMKLHMARGSSYAYYPFPHWFLPPRYQLTSSALISMAGFPVLAWHGAVHGTVMGSLNVRSPFWLSETQQ